MSVYLVVWSHKYGHDYAIFEQERIALDWIEELRSSGDLDDEDDTEIIYLPVNRRT